MKNFFLITGAYGNILGVQPKAFPGRLFSSSFRFRIASFPSFVVNPLWQKQLVFLRVFPVYCFQSYFLFWPQRRAELFGSSTRPLVRLPLDTW
jgi:hypothetical protein